MPGPSSRTARVTASPRDSIRTVIVPPSGETSSALESTLSRTWSRWPGLADTTGRSSASRRRAIRTPRSSAAGRQTARRSATTSGSGVGSAAVTFASARASTSRSLTRRLIRTTSAVACSTSSRTNSSSTPSAMLSRDSRSAVSGVLSWCEASATKMRCEATRVSRRSAPWLRVRARVWVSGGPVTGERAVRSPSLNLLAMEFSSRSGRVIRRAATAPIAAAAARTSTASPARKPQICHRRSVIPEVEYTIRTAPRPCAGTVTSSRSPQMKSEPQSVVESSRPTARVSAASGAGSGRSGAQVPVGVTWTSPGVSSPYAFATRSSASQEMVSPLPSSSAIVRASRRTDSSVSSRSCLVRVKATGTVNSRMATATSRM